MDNEQLLQALSEMMDEKLKSELKPIHNDIQTMRNDIRSVKDDIQSVKDDIETVKDDIQKINLRLDKAESQVSALRSGQIDIRKEIKEVSIKVSETYTLALESWGQSTENRKWLEKI